MENLNNDLESECVNDGPSSRKRLHSPVISAQDSDSDSSSSSGSSPKKRKSRRDSQTVSYAHFDFLSQQIAFLANLISKNTDTENTNSINKNTTSVSINELNLRRPEDIINKNCKLQILSEISTTVKDPIYPKANDTFLKKLSELQRFKCDDWYAVRFSDAQKKYLATPGFVELSVNDELKRFESAMLKEDSRSYLLERTFAALTNAILCQKDELHKTLQSLVDWSNESRESLTPSSLFEKVEKLFSKESSYSKVTDDLLQIVCGRRADFINIRREAMLRQISEGFHRDVLHKIPPSTESLFNDEAVQTYLQKIGGPDKLTTSTKSVPQTYSKDNFYQNQKPSTSKQADDRFFRRDTFTRSQKHSSQTSRQNKNKSNNPRVKPRGKKSQPSFKNKRRE